MQKSFIAIALALTLTCAFAYVSPNTTAYTKAPQSVVANTELNYTNSSNLALASVAIGELDLFAANYTSGPVANLSAGSYSAAWRKLDGKTLSASTNSSSTFPGTMLLATILNGYAITLSAENDTNAIPQLTVYQSAVVGGATVARIFATSNTNASWTPGVLGVGIISKTVYVFYSASGTPTATKVNVTNFVAGGAKGSLEFTLTTALNNSYAADGLNVVWGEALGSSQLFANWQEGTVLKDATVDVSKGTVTANTVGNWQLGYSCIAYSTDKKWFGDLCTTSTNGTQSIYVRSNTTSLALLTTNNQTLSTLKQVVPYGPYIAVIYTDNGVTTAGNTTYSYEILNLDTGAAYRNRTTFLTADSTVGIYRVTSAGLYTITLDRNVKVDNLTYAYQNVQVGLFLGSSYLTSVLGFIMTIVAGLFLF
jgi:hypothetical protein